jgi:hypothetical protein
MSFDCKFIVLFIVASFMCSRIAMAQEPDTTAAIVKMPIVLSSTPDSIFKFNVTRSHPKRAALYSACLPGLGQFYNKQYWKIGLITAGNAVITGFLINNYNQYNRYRSIYIGMIDNNPQTPDTYENYTVQDVKFIRDGYRRFLQYSVLAATAGYFLTILDAFISAHLKTFDMSKDISLKMRPVLEERGRAGISVCIGFHK